MLHNNCIYLAQLHSSLEHSWKILELIKCVKQKYLKFSVLNSCDLMLDVTNKNAQLNNCNGNREFYY